MSALCRASRHNPQFNADELGRALAHQNIDYVPLQALGGLRHARGAAAVAKGRPSRQLLGRFCIMVGEVLEPQCSQPFLRFWRLREVFPPR
jgi:hypothetical protein